MESLQWESAGVALFFFGVSSLLSLLLDAQALCIMVGLRGSEPWKRVVVPWYVVLVNHVAGLSLVKATYEVEKGLRSGADASQLSVALIAQFSTSTFLSIEMVILHTLLHYGEEKKQTSYSLLNTLWSSCVVCMCTLYGIASTLIAVRLDTSLLRLVLSSEWMIVIASPLLQAAALAVFERQREGSAKRTPHPVQEVSFTTLRLAAAAVTVCAGLYADVVRVPPAHFRFPKQQLHPALLLSPASYSLFFVAITVCLLFAIAQVFARVRANAPLCARVEGKSSDDGFIGTEEHAKEYASAAHEAKELLKLAVGSLILLSLGPVVAVQVALCTAWEFADKHSVNLIRACEYIVDKVEPVTSRFTRNPKDGYIVVAIGWLGVCLPAWFFYELYVCVSYGFDWRRLAFYNLVRIGPMYMHFMHVYVLCHKEGHLNGNLLAEPYKSMGLKYIFNLWIGMFHGVVPGTFTYSHVYNHHKYDNGAGDVYSTAYRPRDRVRSWVKYLPEWFAYASNISSLAAFYGEGKMRLFYGTALSTLYYVAFLLAVAYFHPWFCLWSLVYAFVEGNILLSVVNFTWHAFIDENDPGNPYINSTTIVEGLNFTGKEEYHTVHHQYAGAHRLQHEQLYLNHEAEYRASRASIFYKCNIFEVFGLCVSKNYELLADRYYYKDDAGLGMSRKEIAEMLKKRLRAHGPLLAEQVGKNPAIATTNKSSK